MAYCRRGRGYARPFEPRKEMHKRGPSSFEISEDGIQFRFPMWQNTPKDPSLISEFSASLKSIGGYSEDEEKNFSNEKSHVRFMNMKYYPSLPSRELKVSLNLDIEEIPESYNNNTDKESFNNLLTWILNNEDVFTKAQSLDEESKGKGATFVTRREVLISIGFNYNSRVANDFFATCFGGVIYLTKTSDNYCPPYVRKWADVFKKLVSHNKCRNNKVMKLHNMMESRLGEHRMIFSSPSGYLNPDKFQEKMASSSATIDISCCYDNPQNYLTKNIERYKMFNWFLWLLLNGAPEVIVGYRDDDGTVDLLKMYDKNDLMQKGQGYWDMDCVFEFLRHLFSFVKERTESKPGAIFHFVKKYHSNIYTCSECEEEILPEWFKSEFKTDPVPRD